MLAEILEHLTEVPGMARPCPSREGLGHQHLIPHGLQDAAMPFAQQRLTSG
jgi:hypothetical protein